MKKQTKTIVGIAVVVVVLGVSAVQIIQTKLAVIEVDGTITHIDLPSRSATLEFINPRNGKLVEIAGPVPPECTIELNGKPADVDEIVVGDQARVRVRWNKKTKRAIPVAVWVTRAGPPPGGAVTTSRPTTQPAT
jgi:hypothetical protein